MLPADGHLDYTGHYRQTLFNGRIDHRLTTNQKLMFASIPIKSTTTIRRTRSAERTPRASPGGTRAKSWSAQLNHTWVINNTAERGTFRIPQRRSRDPLGGADEFDHLYARRGTCPVSVQCPVAEMSVPFTIGQSRPSDLWGKQWQFSDTLSWTHGEHYFGFGGSIIHHTIGRHRQRARS